MPPSQSAPVCVAARYRGPSRSANGGYVAGLVAHEVGGTLGRALTVTLRQPPPLDVGMHLEPTGDAWSLTFGGALVASAEWHAGDVDPVEAVTPEIATAASTTYPGLQQHPVPECFACAPGREDGLRIFPGEVEPAADGSVRVAAPWTPDDSVRADFHEYASPDPRTCLAATWAALDCIGGWACDLVDRPMVLGRMTAVVDDLPVVGEPHVVTGQHRGDDGRKSWSAATLWDADGRVVARAEHVWLRVDPARFNG